MIQARCLQRSGFLLQETHRHLHIRPSSSRNFSSSIAGAPRLGIVGNRLYKSWPAFSPRRWPLQRHETCIETRLASTIATASSTTDFQPEFASSSTTFDGSSEEFLSTSLEDVTASVPAPVYEHLGFLKEMGLDYGWGPTAMMQSVLEHVHIYAATPWWASIGISLLVVRALLLKIYFDAADAAARNQLITQYNAPLMQRFQEAQRTKDMPEMNRAWQGMKDLRLSAGVKYWKIFLPFIQIPIGFGTFRLMRGMSHLPVPGLESGGLLWMKDLTLSDPYLVLPVLTGACYYYSFKIGGESGSTAAVNPTMKKIFLYGIPPFSALIMYSWPGALQLTFFIQALIAMVQAATLRQDWFRRLIGIQPVPKPEDTSPVGQVYSGTMNKFVSADGASEAESKGFFQSVRAAIDGVRSTAQKWSDEAQKRRQQPGRRTPGELKHAKAYDERRKREIAQSKRFERQQQIEAEERKRDRRR